MRVGAVIAAAGKSGGYKSYDKMKSVDGIQVLRQMILNFKRAGVDEIVLITGGAGGEETGEAWCSISSQ